MDIARFQNILRNRSGQMINRLLPPESESCLGANVFPFNLIFVASRWDYRSRFNGDGFEYKNFLPAFKNLCRNVYFVPAENKQKIIPQIMSFCAKTEKNVILSVFQKPGDIPTGFFELSKKGFYLANWYTDDDMFFDKFSKNVACCFNLNITTFEANLDRYRQIGAKAFASQWGALACYPFLEKRRYLACFAGRMYGERIDLFKKIKDEFGSAVFLNDTRIKPLKENEMIEAYRNSWLAIDDPLASDGKNLQIKARIFENPACGCLTATKSNPRLLKYFKPGQEIIFWKDTNDLIHIINDCRKNPEPYKKMAGAAYSRVKENHLYLHRFSEIFDFIKNDL